MGRRARGPDGAAVSGILGGNQGKIEQVEEKTNAHKVSRNNVHGWIWEHREQRARDMRDKLIPGAETCMHGYTGKAPRNGECVGTKVTVTAC